MSEPVVKEDPKLKTELYDKFVKNTVDAFSQGGQPGSLQSYHMDKLVKKNDTNKKVEQFTDNSMFY